MLTFERESEFDCRLIYKVLKIEKPKCDIIDEKDIYSLLVLMYNNGVCKDYVFCYDIARDRERAEEICGYMLDNEVMPCQINDVLADCL